MAIDKEKQLESFIIVDMIAIDSLIDISCYQKLIFVLLKVTLKKCATKLVCNHKWLY